MIYLDNNATTQPHPSVREKVLENMAVHWGNPSSAHALGLGAKTALDVARRQVAGMAGAEADQVLFTSSATEAIHTAMASALRAASVRRRIVVAATEHSAVLTFARETRGLEVVTVPVTPAGAVIPAALKDALTEDTALVAVMWANNETGVLNPVKEIGEVCRERRVPFICDAVQVAGKLPLVGIDCDYLALSAHKLHGPKGVGALIIGRDCCLVPVLPGKQEDGRRGGTENVPAIVGFGEAARLAQLELPQRNAGIAKLRDRLEEQVLARVPGTVVHGRGSPRLPNTTNIGFARVEADALVAMLDQQGLCASTGSACLSAALAPSHVILAMTSSHQAANEAVRFSLSVLNTAEEIDRAVDIIQAAVAQLR